MQLLFIFCAAGAVRHAVLRCIREHGLSIVWWLQRADTALADRLASFCTQWLSGDDARMARAAAQTMGIFAAVEGARFGRRVPALLQIVLPALQKAAQEVSHPPACCHQFNHFSRSFPLGMALPVPCRASL